MKNFFSRNSTLTQQKKLLKRNREKFLTENDQLINVLPSPIHQLISTGLWASFCFDKTKSKGKIISQIYLKRFFYIFLTE